MIDSSASDSVMPFEIMKELGLKVDKNHQNALNILDKQDEKRNVTNDNTFDSSIDMLVVLSQITVKVPLSDLLRTLETCKYKSGL